MSDVRLWTPPGTDVLPAAGNGTPHNRRRWLTRERFRGLLSIVVILVIGAGVLYWRANSGFVKTDNAQTHGDLAPISPRVSGTVLRVLVEEHDPVRAGTELVYIDPTDYRLALAQAEAQRTTALANEQAAAAALAAQQEAFTAGLNMAQGTGVGRIDAMPKRKSFRAPGPGPADHPIFAGFCGAVSTPF